MIINTNQKLKMIKSADGEWNYPNINLNIVYRPRKENVVADAISYIPATSHSLK